MDKDTIKDRMLGCLYGQAVGNALGIVTEFLPKAEVRNKYPEPLTTYPGHRGEWEDDDTNQMLCVLDELVDHNGIEPRGLAARFNHWLETDGRGCGTLVYNVIVHRDFLIDPLLASEHRWVLSHRNSAPNGGVMRTSVIGLIPSDVEQLAATACKVTHFDPRCIGSSVIVSLIIHNLVWRGKELSYEEIREIGLRYDERIAEWIDKAYFSTDIEALYLDESHSIGFTLRTLAAALWCFWHAQSFKDGLVSVVNEGGDADTNAAVACAILGAKFGYSAIPKYYIDNLVHADAYHARIEPLINKLLGSCK